MKSINLGRVAMIPKGVYSELVMYHALDIVAYQGSSYLVLKDVIGVTPTDDGETYMLLAQKGEQGPKGDTGPQGNPGMTGAKGDKGDTGPKGDTGTTGAPGPQGIQGPQGNPGAAATINGYNAITLTAGSGISLTNSSNIYTIATSIPLSSVHVETGKYTGNGTDDRTISLGFQPFVLLFIDINNVNSDNTYAAHHCFIYNMKNTQTASNAISWGMKEFYVNRPMNTSYHIYYWAAIG